MTQLHLITLNHTLLLTNLLNYTQLHLMTTQIGDDCLFQPEQSALSLASKCCLQCQGISFSWIFADEMRLHFYIGHSVMVKLVCAQRQRGCAAAPTLVQPLPRTQLSQSSHCLYSLLSEYRQSRRAAGEGTAVRLARKGGRIQLNEAFCANLSFYLCQRFKT